LTSSDSISHGRFAPGTILDGRYRIIGLLGRGGMGEVYRADDLRLGQPVALKFLPDTVATDSVRLAQFHNEVRTARQVAHPNICRVYDIGEVDGHLFLSMELVDGEDLASSLRRIGRFPEDKATDIARQLCAGLAAAHERGVLHRDLKPANVMLDGTGKVRVMDFGLAAVGVVDDVRAGTPAYMAPEQLLGREVTQRSDIYALGLVLYELFTGRRAFTAATLNELVEQHQSEAITPPRSIVSTIDPDIERAILGCLDPDRARRPTSALAVAAALPGGDPLAAALAAGETPSPEMVAAAGEGAGLSQRVAIAVFAAIVIGIAAAYVLALRTSLLERLRPEFTADVLAQKSRDAIRQIGYTDRPQDEAYGFFWDTDLLEHVRDSGTAPARWDEALSARPSSLLFWYRRSQSPMIGVQFHHDLLTPGIVTPDDPAPIESRMMQITLDHQGLLTSFEAIAPQVQESATAAKPVDWTPLLTLAGLDAATLQAVEPQWNFLAASDTRAAWTGNWPGSAHPLRVEAAALHGQPVAFLTISPWTKPSRVEEAGTPQETVFATIILVLVLAILIGGGVLARKNLRAGRGDRAGAFTLAAAVATALWALWICEVHVAPSMSMMGSFLIAVCTTTFYGVLFWAIYLALEPFVRRHWPQTLVSWTTLLGGRVRDPVVGRDVLVGVALGVSIALLIRSTELADGNPIWVPHEVLLGARSTAGEILKHVLYAMRTALFVFYLLFLLRVLLRNRWAAALAFVSIFAALNTLTSDRPLFDAATTALYFGMFAAVVLRWGLTSLAVGVLVADLLLVAPATTSFSAWYLGATILVIAIPMALAAWAFYTSVGGRLLKVDAFE
jgi:Protein kinase domain